MSTAGATPAWQDDERSARAAWSRLAEPGDATAGALVNALGAVGALHWLTRILGTPGGTPASAGAVAGARPAAGAGTRTAAPPHAAGPAAAGADEAAGPAAAGADEAAGAAAAGADEAAGAASSAGDPRAAEPAHLPAQALSALAEHTGELGADARRRLRAGVVRWSGRWDGLDPRRDLDLLDALGGTLLHPGHPGWPTALDDLGPCAPPALWVCGDADLDTLVRRSVALVGARASTSYGDHVAADLAAGLADRRFTVVSGGAYGIDAAAHRAAVAVGAPTVVLLAGGVDRPYPAGNAHLLRRVVETGGAVVSEVPPGSVPSRSRFLQRNRLIAAAGRATVVVEAAWRSGALSTAGHAVALLRPVGAVPGPVTSMASAGCHRLLRDGSAVCVTDAPEVAELAGDVGGDLAPPRAGAPADSDALPPEARRVLDALPVVRPAPSSSVARAAGLGEGETWGALGLLELAGLAARDGGGWVRARPRRSPPQMPDTSRQPP